MSSSILLEQAFSDDVCAIYRGRALLVLAWRSTPTINGIRNMSQLLFSSVRGTVSSALVDTEMPMPDAATREALQVSIQRLGLLRGAVNVISGRGFGAAAMRGMLSGFALVVRPKYPTSFVSSAAEAASFVVTTGHPGTRRSRRGATLPARSRP